jgi:uncharacterized membrane protein YdbT with pleckstrin-like domain
VGYVEDNLVSGETVLYRARLHWNCLLRPLVIAILCAGVGAYLMYWAIAPGRPEEAKWLVWVAFALIVIAGLTLGAGIAIRRAAEFAVTNKRVILKTGIFRRRTLELFLNKVESIGVEQSVMGRVFGYGSIVVHGTGGSAEPFHNISRPLQFRHQVQEQIGRLP